MTPPTVPNARAAAGHPGLPNLPNLPNLPKGLARWLWPSLLTAAAYFFAGWVAILLAIPPGYASPLYPGAGLALAVALVYGHRALPGVALGAYLVNVLLAVGPHLPTPLALTLPLVTAAGAALQAALGAALVRWRLPGPLVLDEPRDVAIFCLLGAVLACTVNASMSTLALSAGGVLPPGARAFTWWTWWAGDTLGVLIGAPMALTLIGRPRSDWSARRITLALPLLVTTLLLAAATVLVARWDTQRSQSVFERDAAAAAAGLAADLRQSLFALEALHGLYVGSDDVSADELRRVAQPWLALSIQPAAVGYIERVARTDIARFDATTQRLLKQPYRVFDRQGANQVSLAAHDAHVLAIRLIEPLANNDRALGVNALSVAAARGALQRAISTDAPQATAGFLLTQESTGQAGVVLYRALYTGEPTPDERPAALRGMVFVSLRMQQSVTAAMREAPSYLAWCVIDGNPAAALKQLAGPPGCANKPAAALHHEASIAIGGQQWVLRIDANSGEVPDAGHGNAWLFSTVGLLSAAMLAALLLTVTGRTQRIEAAVGARTFDLQREVAERQRTESALRESEQRFRNIFDHAHIGIAFTDLEGQIREANPRLRELMGYSAEELSKLSIAELTHPNDRADDALGLRRLLAGELPEVQRRSRLMHRDGPLLWVQMTWSVLRGPGGEPQRLVAVVEDITDQLRRQEAEQGRQLAETANRAKNEFLSRMSHELRTPLNAMLGFAQLLELDRKQRLSTRQQGWTAQILQAGWHLLEMINDTLDLSRIEAGMLKLSLAPIDLQPLIAHCMAMVGPAALQHGITLEVHTSPEARHALGDETRLKQVISNLLSNAVKYNVPGGRVVLGTRCLDSLSLEIRVLDTGLGLSEPQMAELFQPFNRLGRELSGTEGTGIGLVISRRLAELMHGTLTAESVEGEGATFVLTLPMASAASLPADTALAQRARADRYHHRHVHYVEDNETNIEVMRGILAQRPQVSLAVSKLGLDGLADIRARRPDLILLDMQLPDVDGLALLMQLQHDPACADIPVVVVSADATPKRIEEALAAGARHYLTKPLNLGNFLGVLDELLESMDTRFG